LHHILFSNKITQASTEERSFTSFICLTNGLQAMHIKKAKHEFLKLSLTSKKITDEKCNDY